jgi:amino acid transporter
MRSGIARAMRVLLGLYIIIIIIIIIVIVFIVNLWGAKPT